MKKIIAIFAVLTTVASVQAALISQIWTSQATVANISGYPKPPYFLTAPESQGDGAGWAYEVWDITANLSISGDKAASDVTLGWYKDGNGNDIGYVEQGFKFDAIENHEVAFRIYNNTVKPTTPSGWYLQSQSLILPDLDDTTPGTGSALTFDFTGQTWTQIPEPATFSLIGLVGLGMIVARRRALRKASNL